MGVDNMILIWVLSWIALFAAVVFWPSKPLLPAIQYWQPTADDLERLHIAACQAYTQRKLTGDPDNWVRIV